MEVNLKTVISLEHQRILGVKRRKATAILPLKNITFIKIN